MEQQIPVISVPMPGKSQQNAQINAERHAISVTVGSVTDMGIVHIFATKAAPWFYL